MGSTVELDGRALGVATDQWLRYAFPVAKLLTPGASHEPGLLTQGVPPRPPWILCR